MNHLIPQPGKSLPELRLLGGRKVNPHQAAGRASGVEQRAGGEQVALVQHALAQGIGVHTGFHPAEQAYRIRCKRAAVGQRQLHAAGAGGVQLGTDALGVPAELALVYAPGHGFFQ